MLCWWSIDHRHGTTSHVRLSVTRTCRSTYSDRNWKLFCLNRWLSCVHSPLWLRVVNVRVAKYLLLTLWDLCMGSSLPSSFITSFFLPAGSAAGSSAGISFTHGPILGFFAPQGRHVAPIKVKFGREERSFLPNLTLIGSGVGVYGPQNWKKFEFYQYNCP